jgi:hypothetical protein
MPLGGPHTESQVAVLSYWPLAGWMYADKLVYITPITTRTCVGA